jgi:hypothetical protein
MARCKKKAGVDGSVSMFKNGGVARKLVWDTFLSRRFGMGVFESVSLGFAS